jgi:hypothetical protein
MAANTLPIYTRLGDVQWTTTPMTALNATTDLTTGTIYLAFTADATEGGYVQRIRFKAVLSTNTATVARVWLNNGLTTATAANNVLIDEISLPTATASSTAALPVYELPLNFAMPPGYTIYITLGTAVTGGWKASVIGGKY